MRVTEATDRRKWFASAAGLLIGGAAYFLILLDFRSDLTRTATQQGWFSNFYDLQAKAFLEGRLDVPAGSLGIEGFVVDGRTYTYFGPIPALLRLPALLVSDAFYGRLTLASMALGWLVFAGATTALLWRVHAALFADQRVSRFQAVLAALFLATATGGTTLTYDASLPWVYHEAYIWAEATAMLSLYLLLRTLEDPTRTNVLLLGFSATATILTRTPAGWAVCAATLASAIWYGRARLRERHPDAWASLASAALVPLGIGVAYNIAKFHHPWLFPLQDQVWTLVNERRREALAINGGSITGPQFLETSLVNYFRPDGIRFTGYFPYVSLPAEPAQAYGGAFLDQSYRTGSVTSFMPLLVLLSIVGVGYVVRRRIPQESARLRPVFAGGILVSSGVMGYGYLANRYTSDLVPGVVVGGAIGLWALARVLRARRLVRALVAVTIALLSLFGVLAQMAVGQQTAAQNWRGDRLEAYVALQHRLSGGAGTPYDTLVRRSVGPPSSGGADDLYIEGDCDALYLNTGDAYEPWILVQRRGQVVEVAPGKRLRKGHVDLAQLTGNAVRTVRLESDGSQLRVVVLDGELRHVGPWLRLAPSETLRIGIGFDTATGTALVTTTPGGVVGRIPFVEWGTNWHARPGRFEWLAGSDGRQRRLNVEVSQGPGLPLELCRTLLAEGS